MQLLHRGVTDTVIVATHELTSRGVRFARQVPLPVVYREVRLDCGYRMDFVIQDYSVLSVSSVVQHG